VRRDVVIINNFAAEARRLRAHFDARFADPRDVRADRFVWDYWHVPEQYTVLRTPAYEFFPKKIYEAFHRRLVAFGRRVLGCHDISPPWLSCYVDGCRQELHADVPHGQWAFVFSLTLWRQRSFDGGETLLLRPEVLDYWRDFPSGGGVEHAELIAAVAAEFNRLVVFDPRIPHGVRTVTGTRDPRFGRLVVHGWFVQPRPFVEGALSVAEVEQGLAPLHEAIESELQGGLAPLGLLSLHFTVSPAGRVTRAKVLSDTTRTSGEDEPRRRAFVRQIHRAVGRLHFAHRRTGSAVTLPLVFSA
jgi:hypothetical protein